jgi:Sugar (and other) transporter.
MARSYYLNNIFKKTILVSVLSNGPLQQHVPHLSSVTQPHLRGMLSALASVGVSLGVLIEYALGSVVTWTVLAGISAAIPILALLLIILMPETPNWLLTHGHPLEAKDALRKFRSVSPLTLWTHTV